MWPRLLSQAEVTTKAEAKKLPHVDQEWPGQKDSEKCRCANLMGPLMLEERCQCRVPTHVREGLYPDILGRPLDTENHMLLINIEADGHTGQPQTHG